MKIVIASDHRGYALKQEIIKNTFDGTITWVDLGCHSSDRCDFPEYAKAVVSPIKAADVHVGVLLCGTGVGMSIAANRHPEIYAALCFNPEIAQHSKEHNSANILVIPADYVDLQTAIAMIQVWNESQFLGGRYEERIKQIDADKIG